MTVLEGSDTISITGVDLGFQTLGSESDLKYIEHENG